jgi:hypothetical protein
MSIAGLLQQWQVARSIGVDGNRRKRVQGITPGCSVSTRIEMTDSQGMADGGAEA